MYHTGPDTSNITWEKTDPTHVFMGLTAQWEWDLIFHSVKFHLLVLTLSLITSLNRKQIATNRRLKSKQQWASGERNKNFRHDQDKWPTSWNFFKSPDFHPRVPWKPVLQNHVGDAKKQTLPERRFFAGQRTKNRCHCEQKSSGECLSVIFLDFFSLLAHACRKVTLQIYRPLVVTYTPEIQEESSLLSAEVGEKNPWGIRKPPNNPRGKRLERGFS